MRDLEAPAGEQLGHERGDHRLVLDQQDAPGERRASRRARPLDRRERRGRRRRQQDAKARAARLERIDEQMPAMVVDDAVDHRQPHSRAASDRLGGVERLEHALAHCVAHAAAGVGDRQHDPGAAQRRAARRAHGVGRLAAEADPDRARAVDRVARVDAEIEQHLLDLHRVADDRGRRVVERGVQLDRARQRRAQQLRRLAQLAGEGERAPLAALTAREREHLRDQVARPLRGQVRLAELAHERRPRRDARRARWPGRRSP